MAQSNKFSLIVYKAQACSGDLFSFGVDKYTKFSSAEYEYSADQGNTYVSFGFGAGAFYEIKTNVFVNNTNNPFNYLVRAKVNDNGVYLYSGAQSITVWPKPLPEGKPIVDKKNVCPNDTVKLNVSSSHKFIIWQKVVNNTVFTFGSNTQSASDVPISNLNFSSGYNVNSYRVQYTDGYCDARFTDTVNVLARNNPPQLFLHSKQSKKVDACVNTPLSVYIQTSYNLNTPPVIEWEQSTDNKKWQLIPNSAQQTKFLGSTTFGFTTQFSNGASNGTKYFLRAKTYFSNCSKNVNYSESITVNVYSLPVGGKISDLADTTCANTSLSLNLQNYTGKISSWEWISPANSTFMGLPNSANQNPCNTPILATATPSTYKFRALVNNAGCVGVYSDTLSVVAMPVPTDASENTSMYNNLNFQIFYDDNYVLANKAIKVMPGVDAKKVYFVFKNQMDNSYQKVIFPFAFKNNKDTTKKYYFNMSSDYCPNQKLITKDRVTNVLPKSNNYPVKFPSTVCANAIFDVSISNMRGDVKSPTTAVYAAYKTATLFRLNVSTNKFEQVQTLTYTGGTSNFIFKNLSITQNTTFKIELANLYAGYKVMSKTFTVNVAVKANAPSIANFGSNNVCPSTTSKYKIDNDVNSVMWSAALSPVGAGVVTKSNDSLFVQWSSSYSGFAKLKLKSLNMCNDADSVIYQFSLYTLPVVSIQNLSDKYCFWSNSSALVATIKGGVFSGSSGLESSVNSGEAIFNPSLASNGYNTIKYTTTDPSSGCAISTQATTYKYEQFFMNYQSENTINCPGENKNILYSYQGEMDSVVWFYRKNMFSPSIRISNNSTFQTLLSDSTFGLNILATAEWNGYQVYPRIYGYCAGQMVGAISTINLLGYPAFTVEPSDKLVCEGNSISHSISLKNQNLFALNWQEDLLDGNGFQNVYGPSQNTFTKSNVSASYNGSKVRVMISGGACGVVYSKIAVNTVKAKPMAPTHCNSIEGWCVPSEVELCIFDWDFSHPYNFAIYDSNMTFVKYGLKTPFVSKNTTFYLTQKNTQLNCESDPIRKDVIIGNPSYSNLVGTTGFFNPDDHLSNSALKGKVKYYSTLNLTVNKTGAMWGYQNDQINPSQFYLTQDSSLVAEVNYVKTTPSMEHCTSAKVIYITHQTAPASFKTDESLQKAEEMLASDIVLYPNPANENINLVFEKEENKIGLIIYDSQGKKILQHTEYSSIKQINLNVVDLPSGMYTMQILTKEGSKSLKFVKK